MWECLLGNLYTLYDYPGGYAVHSMVNICALYCHYKQNNLYHFCAQASLYYCVDTIRYYNYNYDFHLTDRIIGLAWLAFLKKYSDYTKAYMIFELSRMPLQWYSLHKTHNKLIVCSSLYVLVRCIYLPYILYSMHNIVGTQLLTLVNFFVMCILFRKIIIRQL